MSRTRATRTRSSTGRGRSTAEPNRSIQIVTPEGETITTKHGNPRSALSQAQGLAERCESDSGTWEVREYWPNGKETLFAVTLVGGMVFSKTLSDVD